MKAKDLRNSILQLAVQGKLVPQDPNDEPVSALLERIRAERAKLIKDKKIRAPKGGESIIYRASDGSHYEKRGKGEPVCIDDEIPFEIPESWEWARLGMLCTKIGSGSTPPGGRNVYKPTGPMLIRSQNVYDDGLRLDDVAHFDSALYEKRGSHVLPNDILLNITGASIGRCAIVPPTFDDADVNQHVLILRQVDVALLAYVHLVITSPVVQMAIMNVQVGATKEGLSASKASELLIPMAPLEEQRRITERVAALLEQVGEYSALEEAREHLDAELPDKLRKSILQLAVQGKLVPQDPADEPASALLERMRAERAVLIKAKKIRAPKGGESIIYRDSDGCYYEKRGKGEPVCIDDEIPFEIPESWEWARVKDFGFFSSGKTPPKHDQSLYGGSHLWVTSKDMKSLKIARTGIMLSDKGADGLNTYPVGTMLFVVRSGILKRFLPIAILDKPATINQDIKALTLYDSSIAVGLAYSIKAFEPYILEELTKSVTTVDSLRFDEFQDMLIPVPPEAEWSRIVTQLDTALGNVITNQ